MENKKQKIEQIYNQALAGQTKLAMRNLKKLRDGKKKQKFGEEDSFFLQLVENLCYIKEYRFGQAMGNLQRLDHSALALSPQLFGDIKKFILYISSIVAESPLISTIEKSEPQLAGDFDFYKHLVFYYYHVRDFKKLAGMLTKIHKIKANANILFASFYLKLYHMYAQQSSEALGETPSTDVELYFTGRIDSMSAEALKAFKMNLDLTILTGNKFKGSLSANNAFLLKKLEVLKAVVNGQGTMVAQHVGEGIDYNTVKFIEGLVSLGIMKRIDGYGELVSLYASKISQLVKIDNIKDVETKLLNQEAIANFIVFCAHESRTGILADLLLHVKDNFKLLDGVAHQKLLKSNVWTYFSLSKHIGTDESYSTGLLGRYVAAFHQTQDFISPEFLALIGEKHEGKFMQLVQDSQMDIKTKSFWMLKFDYHKEKITTCFATAFRCIREYFQSVKSDQKIEKGQRRDEDELFLIGSSILLNIHKKFRRDPSTPIDLSIGSLDDGKDQNKELDFSLSRDSEPSYLLFTLHVVEAAKNYSPYNFDMTKQLAYVNSQLGLVQQNMSLFYAEDYKGNQHETLGPLFFNGLIGLNLQIDDFVDRYQSFFAQYSENYREAGKNTYNLAKHGNMNVFAEMDIYNHCFSQSYFKGLIYVNLKSKLLHELLKNPGDADLRANVTYFSDKIADFKEKRYINWNLDDFENTLDLFDNIHFSRVVSAIDDVVYRYIVSADADDEGLARYLSAAKDGIEGIRNHDFARDFIVVRRNTPGEHLVQQSRKIDAWMTDLLNLDEVKQLLVVYGNGIQLLGSLLDKAKAETCLKDLVTSAEYFAKYEHPASRVYTFAVVRLVDMFSKLSALSNHLTKHLSSTITTTLKHTLKQLVDKVRSSSDNINKLEQTELPELLEKLKTPENNSLFNKSKDTIAQIRVEEYSSVIKGCLQISGLK